jgi:urease accessory protein
VADAQLTIADIFVLGRIGSGERVRAGRFVDRWRIRRSYRLIHAEATRLDGAIDEHLAAAAVAGGRSVIATLVHVCEDAGDLLDQVRDAIAGTMEGTIAAASAHEDRVIVRALGHRSDDVRAVIARVLACLTKRPLPRSWAT